MGADIYSIYTIVYIYIVEFYIDYCMFFGAEEMHILSHRERKLY